MPQPWTGGRVARVGNPRKGFGPDYGSGRPANYNYMTVYMPQTGGINGHCGGGGGTRAMDPCKFFLDDYLRATSTTGPKCVVAATQRAGGTASVYGCIGEASTMNKRFNRKVKICFADVYARSQNPDRVRASKFDVAIRAQSRHRNKVTPRENGKIVCTGRTPGTQNVARRTQRNQRATGPVRRRG